ncbi:MAG: hypothetical protein NVS1B13_18020 [Flavisolibacter sp.]
MLSATTPKDWARAHPNVYLKKDFINSESTLTLHDSEKILAKTLGYQKIENKEIVICYPFKNL